ncbi:hypothetical protein P154DRAFT_469201 [Amniculicola lignicola CBS 123094]|uniref:Autophagy-related protein 2 n=1 Tax=Amniculicola lignicola CBS 123094 TaxID=1392246 RepID=A0A6A5WEW4_9PLEO|nr:hypothetical protein P154DRAFT_469201 [Amniculicola lignicola CBS 123094]
MAFFSAFSSRIGERLLLFGLRHIDILDKDPADFVSVDVGKQTTLEVRDVGLHVKKLVALLHLKLPPEVHLSKAKASLLRVTFVFEFGVPQIIIEIDGVQVQARLADVVEDISAKPSSPPRTRSQKHGSPTRRRKLSPRRPPFDADSDDASSDDDETHVPTMDDLAQSFIREEPAEEIRELEEALGAQADPMAESVASSDDGEDEGVVGMGAAMGLPAVLRNLLNTALDRLQIIANHIDIEVEDQMTSESATSSDGEPSSVSLNFHVDRVAIDSVTAQDPRVEVSTSNVASDASSKDGKRRMRIENIYARLISDAENFASMSRVSRPESPADTRSDIMSSHKSESSVSSGVPTVHALQPEPQEPPSPLQASVPSVRHVPVANTAESSHGYHQLDEDDDQLDQGDKQEPLTSSILTTDDDRFADAASDDGLGQSMMSEWPERPRTYPQQQEMSASSILYDDEGLLDYAVEQNMFDSRLDESAHSTDRWGMDGSVSSHEVTRERPESNASSSNLLSVSALAQSVGSLYNDSALSGSALSEHPSPVTDNLDSAIHHAEEVPPTTTVTQTSPPDDDEDLSESRMFTHEDAESMYMSAMSAPLEHSRSRRAIPGGWDSASSSSQDTASDTSGPIPDSMISGSILRTVREPDDGIETPRPGSRQSVFSSPQQHPPATKASESIHSEAPEAQGKLAKLFLTIDEVTVWFPLGLDDQNAQTEGPEPEDAGLSFESPNLGQDSIFQEIPGSFSNYASTTASRKRISIDVPSTSRSRSTLRPSLPEKVPSSPKVKVSPAAVSVEVGSVVGHVDIAAGRIMFQMFERALKALTGMKDEEKAPPKPQEEVPKSRSSIELTVRHFGVAWLERLMTESLASNDRPNGTLDINPLDSILRVNLSSIRLTSQSMAEEARAKILVGKFTLSSIDQEIISFQSARPRSSRSSAVNTPKQLANDVEIDFEQGKDHRVTIVTRPVKVTLDMQKLDDALSSFGGFSGVLELGSSISSSSAAGPSEVVAPPKPRGVHFGDMPPPVPSTGPSSMPKIQVQLGDVSFTLKGKSCALQVQTTSVRCAVRETNFRLKVSEVHISGPYVDSSQVAAPLIVEVQGTTANFLFAPDEVDLTRLISMITPSKDPYENDEDILIDTLLRQRRKGSVLRAEVTSVALRVSDLDQLQTFQALGAEVAKLSKVTKYLPDDDRPGILTLALIQNFDASLMVNERLGDISVSLVDTSLAHVGVPSLLALEVGKATVSRADEILVHDVVPLRPLEQLPMIMMRMIGDEMEPVIRVKLFNLCLEYRVSTIMAALGLAEDGTAEDLALGLASSVATITGATSPKALSRQSSGSSSSPNSPAKPLQVDLLLRDCAVGLNPRKIPSKGLFVLTNARFEGRKAKEDNFSATVELRRASMFAIDDVTRLEERLDIPSPSNLPGSRQVFELRESGYVSLSSISSAKVQVNVAGDVVDVEFKNELFILESCADSTQTLIAILNGLQPPTPPSTAQQYRTVVPLQQMMESFTGDSISRPQEEFEEDENFMDNADLVVDEVPTNLEFVGSFYNQDSLPTEEDLGDSMLGEDNLDALATPPIIRQRGERGLLESFQEHYEVTEEEQTLDFNDDYFKDSDSDHKGTARKWNSAKNQYHLTNEFKTPDAPLKVRVRDVNIHWNLYDGYDWPRTRGIIAQAVEDVEARAEERRRRPKEEEEDEDFVEEDFLFNSVWIGVPVKDEKGALARKINHDIDDLASETGSYATSSVSRTTGATARPHSAAKSKRRRLKLERSKHKKIAFSLNGVAMDLIVFPPGSGETQNSINVRVKDFEIFDHVPSSTWKKFVTCLLDPTSREMGRPMINLELLTVRPVTELAASELVIKVTVLPLRLHVDQDALDFITRFFEFKDDSAPEASAPSDQPFIQRLEVMAVTLKLDYKPKRVDYGGIRSGHTTEFMNFLILDGADIILRHAIVYGITSFDKLHKTLNDVWMPDVTRNQLPGVLSGLAAVRPLVNVGSGVRDLVVVPMREYKKDGRIVRSLQKGVYAFAKNTTSEVARLGAKVAIGTQNLLEGAENFLTPQASSPRSPALHDWDDVDTSDAGEDEPRAVSNYANQPIGVRAGLKSAARYLERDLLTARDAIIAIPSEIMEEGTGIGMAKAIARRAPTVILRPALGATKAVSNALLGVGNALDADSRRKIEDKYKSY